MKSLAHLGATLGLIGSAILGTGFIDPQKAFALPQAEVIQVLQPIPVYTIADDKGAPLVAVDKDNKKSTFIFVSKDEANQFYQRLTTEKPDVAKQVKIQVVSLAEIYKVASENAKKPDGLNFSFVPTPEEIDSAKTVLGANGQQYQGGVPLFVARGGPDKGYLTIQQNNQQFVPFFFEKSQLQQMLDQLKKDKPDLASSIQIEVIPLEAIMSTLEEKNDEFLKRIVLWPSSEMMKVIESTIQQQSNQPKK
jgi:hypothetical protein